MSIPLCDFRTVADAILHDSTPVHVHFVMFVPALMGHANEEQQAKWLSDALMMKIVGSYAQTELGHGQQSFLLFYYSQAGVCHQG